MSVFRLLGWPSRPCLILLVGISLTLSGCTGSDNASGFDASTTVDLAIPDAHISPTNDGAVIEPSEGEFVVLTYNVHGLPPFITMDDTAERLRQIAPRLNDFDFVGLQEDFDDLNHQVIAEQSEHGHILRFSDPLDGHFYGSGLSALSRFPIVDHLHVHYSACHGRFDAASDCLASKGVQALRIRLASGVEMDIYNTHLEAGGGPEDHVVRTQHIEELLDVMTTYSAGRAIIFLGDTNLHEDDSDDVVLLNRLKSTVELMDACDDLMCPEPGRIDRVMYRSGNGVILSVSQWQVESSFVDPDETPLSDHDAISTRIHWAATP